MEAFCDCQYGNFDWYVCVISENGYECCLNMPFSASMETLIGMYVL
jgi:hypothetical protein